MGVDRRTARKYADGDELPTPRPRNRSKPKMGPFMEHLEAMILEDMNIPAKQRRTARAMYEQLLELGYEGSARTVRHWVQRLKPQLYAERKERFVRLEHCPGEAQVDKTMARLNVQVDGHERDYQDVAREFLQEKGLIN